MSHVLHSTSLTSLCVVCQKVEKGGSEYKLQYPMLYLESHQEIFLSSDFSGHWLTVCRSPPLFLLSYGSHQISMPECFSLAGWVGRLPTCLQWCHGTWSITQGHSLGTHQIGREGRRSVEASVEWGCLVCMRDGRQCIKRWQLSHSSLNKSGETLAGRALTLIIHLNNCSRSLLPEGACSARQAAMGVGEYENWHRAPGFLICKRVNIYLTQIAKAQKRLSSLPTTPPRTPPTLSLSHRFMYWKNLKFMEVRLSKKGSEEVRGTRALAAWATCWAAKWQWLMPSVFHNLSSAYTHSLVKHKEQKHLR